MLYVGIDLHSKQITVCVRDESGEIVLRKQVSTQPEKLDDFFDKLLASDGEFMAIVEVCGFNDWFIEKLRHRKCSEIVLIQPDNSSKKKTDRRDANKLCELLWCNRFLLQGGKRANGLRRVQIPSETESSDRQLTALRKRLSQFRTKTLNKIHRILHNRNLMWQYPTKTFQTQTGLQWLKQLELPAVDRMEMDCLIEQWELFNKQIDSVEKQIVERVQQTESGEVMSPSQLLMTSPGISFYSSLSIVSRIGDIRRFPSPRSLANFFGLTPGCRNSGNSNHRLGSITKEGSAIVRFILGQLVLHILKKDPQIRAWYRRIKNRRGSKIARVAVMRRLTTIFWHMLTHNEPYYVGGPPRLKHRRLSSGSTKGTKRTAA